MKVWVDIDNPPQTRYLLPLARRFEEVGHDVILTARDYGDTLAILESEDVDFEAIGSSFGKGLRRKLVGLQHRASKLREFSRSQPQRADLVLTGSRSATLAARTLKIPSFVIVDYEYVDLLVFQLSGTHIMYPDVIETARFRRRGLRADHLIPFEGLKEDISFAGVNLPSVPAHDFGRRNGSAPYVLFRPPAEESHYYRGKSGELSFSLLQYLAQTGVTVVFSPRFAWQIDYLNAVGTWREDPVVMQTPVPFVSLFKAVDAVVSAGGTMLREAAYLGIPAYSIFRSQIGAVDRYLASIDRLSILRSPADFERIQLKRKGSLSPLRENSSSVEELVELMLDRVKR